MSTHPIRARLIVNPKAGRREPTLAPTLAILAAHGWDVGVVRKERRGHAALLARQAADDGCDVVIACGGDGTIGEVVAGVVGREIAVGVLPAGTANLWAHEIGLSTRLEQAALQLVAAERRRIDVGSVTIDGKRERHFLLMAGLGFDGAVVARLDKRLKQRIGKLAYVPAIGRALPLARSFAVRAELDGVRWEGKVAQVVVGNTRRYAGVTAVTPEAVVDDGRLDVVLLAPGGRLAATGELVSLLLRRRPAPGTVVADRVRHLRVRVNAAIPLQADGGRVRQKPRPPAPTVYDFGIRPRAVTVLVPRDYSGDLFQHQDEPPPARAPKRRYRVTGIGVETIEVVRERDGWTATVLLADDTIALDADGVHLTLPALLGSLTPGQHLTIRGKKRRKRQLLLAKRIQPIT